MWIEAVSEAKRCLCFQMPDGLVESFRKVLDERPRENMEKYGALAFTDGRPLAMACDSSRDVPRARRVPVKTGRAALPQGPIGRRRRPLP